MAEYPRTGAVDLDLPPRQRWVGIIGQYGADIAPYFQWWDTNLDNHTEIDRRAWEAAVVAALGDEHLEELRGIFGVLEPYGISWNSLVLFQAMYEMGSPLIACSQILAAARDGTVLHARNLDYRVISPLIEITFSRGGRVSHIAPTYLGSTGVHTVIKPGYWSAAVNARLDLENDDVEMVLGRLVGGVGLCMCGLRRLVEGDASYSEALSGLQTMALARSIYFVIAGPGPYEGAVVTHLAEKASRLAQLSEQTPGMPEDAHGWFLLQTNDDLDKSPWDDRRDAGINSMVAVTQENVSPKLLLEVMLKPPLYMQLNNILFMMTPRAGLFCSIMGPSIRDDDRSISDRCLLPGWDSADPPGAGGA